MMPGEINVYIYISFSMTLEAFDPIRSDPIPIRSDPIWSGTRAAHPILSLRRGV